MARWILKLTFYPWDPFSADKSALGVKQSAFSALQQLPRLNRRILQAPNDPTCSNSDSHILKQWQLDIFS